MKLQIADVVGPLRRGEQGHGTGQTGCQQANPETHQQSTSMKMGVLAWSLTVALNLRGRLADTS
jgi:hypothetical protein